MSDDRARYLAPGGAAKIFNDVVARLTRAGISIAGSRVLTVKGRTSGLPRSTPVNLLTVDGVRYLVAPRGETQWVRNLRVAGVGTLAVGRRTEPFTGHELADAEKPQILREYVRRWKWEVGQFFEGLSKNPTDAELAAIAPGFPVFRVERGS